jgi:hypothetical protein
VCVSNVQDNCIIINAEAKKDLDFFLPEAGRARAMSISREPELKVQWDLLNVKLFNSPGQLRREVKCNSNSKADSTRDLSTKYGRERKSNPEFPTKKYKGEYEYEWRMFNRNIGFTAF